MGIEREVEEAHRMHRQKLSKRNFPLFLCPCRPVNMAERRRNPVAWKSVQDEWDALKENGVWDMTSVREWDDVAGEARRKGKKIHLGTVFAICVEKNYQLDPNSPEGKKMRKYKGRVVYAGDRGVDEYHQPACYKMQARSAT